MSSDKIEALDKALAEVFREPHLISNKREPSLPEFDRAAVAGIFSEPLPLLHTTGPSPPCFDHAALAEIFGEPYQVPIDPQPPPISIDEGPSPPRLGETRDEEPAANIVTAAPSTNAESASPQRAQSLLAKIRHIFTAKAETLPSSPEKGSSSVSSFGKLHEPEPTAKGIAAATPTDPEIAWSQREKEPLTEPSRLGFEQEASSPCPSDQQGNPTQALIAATANSPTDIQNLRQVTPSSVETSSPISTHIEPPPSILEKEPSSPTTTGELDNIIRKAESFAVAARADEKSTQPAEALPTELHSLLLDRAESTSVVENGSSPRARSHQVTELEAPIKTVEAVPQADAARPHHARLLLIEPAPPASTIESSSSNPAPATDAMSVGAWQPSAAVDLPSMSPIKTETFPLVREKDIWQLRNPSDQSDHAEAAEVVQTASPSNTESAQRQPTTSSLTESPLEISAHAKSPLATGENELLRRPTSSGQLINVEPATNAVSFASPADTKNTEIQPRKAKPLLSDVSSPPRIVENEPSPLSREPNHAASPADMKPVVRAAAVAAPTDLQSTPPWQAKSLQAGKLLDISRKLAPSLQEASARPILHGRHDDVPDARAAAIGTAPSIGGTVTRGPQAKSVLAELELDNAIRLRWVMRDIRANRTAMSPASENDLATLVELGLVEMRENLPGLTALGILELN